MPDISFIVPVYNLQEEAVSKCINSIVNQTYSDNEIIIIDDGSSNSIEKFCDKLAEQYGILVIHQENQGLASARNIGMLRATGKWIVHVDGDDWVDIHLAEFLVEKSKNCNADIIVWGFILSDGKINKELLLKDKSLFNNAYCNIKEKALYSILGDERMFSAINLNTSWAKAYRRNFIIENNLFYDVSLRRAQDAVYNLYAFDCAKTVAYIDKALNIYRIDNTSLSRGYNPKNLYYLSATAIAVKQFAMQESVSELIKNASLLFIQRCFRMINEQYFQHVDNRQNVFAMRKLFINVISTEPFNSAFQSGYKRSGLFWYISDCLYKHKLFFCIMIYDCTLKFCLKIKKKLGINHFTKYRIK